MVGNAARANRTLEPGVHCFAGVYDGTAIRLYIDGECVAERRPGRSCHRRAEVGEHVLQEQVVNAAREHNVRLMGPNIYGFYYTHKNLCATFCTPYTEKGAVARSSQSGGVGMAIIGFSRSANMGVSAIVGLGNKSDIAEDDPRFTHNEKVQS